MLTLPQTKTVAGALNPDFLRTLRTLFPLTAFVETGTYLGDTAAIASTLFPSVHTIELSEALAQKAVIRFAMVPHVRVHQGDSATMMAKVVGQLDGPTLFWLDGHYSEGVTALGSQNTPIREELRMIAQTAPRGSVILIDDLRLFDGNASQPNVPPSMHGYPSLNEIYTELSGMDYQFFILGDVGLAIPKTTDVAVSSLIQALTISRLYDGQNLEIQEVLDAEKIIINATGSEREVVINMAAPYTFTEQFGLGLHYRFWRSLILLGENRALDAGHELVAAIEKGFSHWRARWYLALILREGQQAVVAQRLVEEILAIAPEFEAGKEFLRRLSSSGNLAKPPAEPLARPMLSTERPLVEQLEALGMYYAGSPLRLHLGCGEYHFDGYLNIDYPPSEHTCQTRIGADVFGDITKLRLPAAALHEIRLHHVFEHFKRAEALALLITWHEALRIGGQLHVETPDVEGCARQLVSDIPFQMKQAVLRHCFGSQEAGWAIHYDGWTEQKYRHVLGKLGFTVKTAARSWAHPPHLANVEAIATKTRAMSRGELLAAADNLLTEYIVADVPSERAMCEVWRKAMREFLSITAGGPVPLPHVESAGATQPETNDIGPRKTAANKRIHGVIFSKDRALQLDATLRSLFACCADAHSVALHVLYLASNPSHQHHYDQLALEYPQVKFMPERSFRTDFIALIEGASEILLIVDDNLFVRRFCLADAVVALAENKDAIGFSLRLGRNTTYCYPFDRSQRVPPLTLIAPGVAKFIWPTSELDFAYPLEVSSSLYRGCDLVPLLTALEFKDPNTLEAKLSESAPRFLESLPALLCFEHSVAFCNPANKVQTIMASNRAGGHEHYSAASFADRFTAGDRVDVSAFIGYTPHGCHEEVDFAFIRRPAAVLSSSNAAPAVSTELVRASVVITCYNYGRYLRDCVRSVANQTFKDFEIIIVNDGSTDNSQAVAEACLAEFPGLQISLLNQPNSGQPALARNAGIRQAKGEFVLPVDADDQIDPGYLAEAFKVIDSDPKVDLVYCDSLFDNGKIRSRKTPGSFDPKALAAANQLVYCCVYRRAIWEKVGGYRDNVRGYEDWDFWLAASLTGANAAYVCSIGLLYKEKAGGVYSQTVAHHQARYAQVMLNNPAAYTSAELQQARTLLATLGAPKPTALVSVVIPCYQQARYLTEAVQSVCAQSYPNWEIIIVNDGSPDNTSEVAQALIYQHSDRRIRLIEKPNGGLADARNAGVRSAQGEYILPLDADDIIAPTFLAKTVALLDQNPGVGIAYTDWIYFGAYQATRNAIDYDFKRLCTKENLFTCTSLYRKKAWDAAGGYNTNMTHGVEDWDFWIGCGEHGFKGQRIPEPLFFYRAKDTSMIHALQPHLSAMFARIILNHPKLYNPEALRKAGEILAEAKLAPPKPSSPGTEWFPTTTTPADFAQSVTEAEKLVRDGQLEAAIAKIEHTLRLAPTAECSARAKEILDLLRAAMPAQAEAAAAGTSAPAVIDEIFGADEVTNVQQLIATYCANPADPVREQLLELQQGLMKFLVTNDPETLEGHFKGSFGVVFRALVESGLSSEAPTTEGCAQLAVLDEALAEPRNHKDTFDYRPLLARMLRAPAHRGLAMIALEKVPAWLLKDFLGYVLHSPHVFVTDSETELYHTHALSWARVILQLTQTSPNSELTMSVALFFTNAANYIPLYFSNRNTRELAEKRAAIIEFVLRKNGAVIDVKLPRRPKNRGKIKVGFLNAHFGAQTETHVTLPTLQLDREKFEICLFATAQRPGPIEDYCRSFADSFTLLPQNVHEQVKIIREAALDVVIIGTNVTAVTNAISLIALHRLAPLQLVSYCSPVSTGMRHVDGYLTGTLNDFPELQDHFSETLQFCEGPPGCLDYTVEVKGSSAEFSRASLGLGADDVVFVNAAACFKILPELQETWAKILKAVPKSRLLLLPFNPNWSNRFPVKQFERTLTEACERHGVGRDRFILADSLPSRADVKSLERVADVYLDTFPFSGSISVIDPLELGLPPVVWEGKTHRSRMAAALLHELEIPELITQDEASYIALSAKLATEPAYRRQLNQRIQAAMARKPKFINPTAYARGLGTLLESLVIGGRKTRLPAPTSECEMALA